MVQDMGGGGGDAGDALRRVDTPVRLPMSRERGVQRGLPSSQGIHFSLSIDQAE